MRPVCRLLLLAVCACASSACTSTAPQPATTAAVESSAAQPAAAPSSAVAPPAEPAAAGGESSKTLRPQPGIVSAETPYLGVIDRAGLSVIIEQGLGRVLARVKLSPVMLRGKFQGFRIDGVDPAWAAAGLLVNDVVLRLNGQPIERPEQAMVAFESLRVASELALELSRDGRKLVLRYRIEGTAPSPSTSSAMAPP